MILGAFTIIILIQINNFGLIARNKLDSDMPLPVDMLSSSASFASNEVQPAAEFINAYRPKIIGVYMLPSVEYIISVLSILRIGEAFLPLDPTWPKDRILSVISSSNVGLIIACGSSFNESGIGYYLLDKSHWLIESGICPVLCFSMEERVEDTIGRSNIVCHCENERQRSFCYLMYTSGSTGKPKGVCGTEQGKQLFENCLFRVAYPKFLFLSALIFLFPCKIVHIDDVIPLLSL